MAKDKRSMFELKCEECGGLNYWTEKNRDNTKDKVELQKYCRKCKKHTKHTESKPKKKKK
jgi:large subunit ribosomal protein L33